MNKDILIKIIQNDDGLENYQKDFFIRYVENDNCMERCNQ